jgi:uncharacterized membrane protein YphA (DoxX/SURF4 family)
MKALAMIGRTVYAIPFGVFGVMHLLSASKMTGAVPAWLPAPEFWVYLTGVALLVACLAMITGKLVRPAAIWLAVLLGVFILTIHIPGLANPERVQMAMMSLLKDTSLLGAALLLAAVSGGKSA